MQMRNRLAVGVGILDKFKDELHLVLVVVNGNFLIESMDTEGRSISGEEIMSNVTAQELSQSTLPASLSPHKIDPSMGAR